MFSFITDYLEKDAAMYPNKLAYADENRQMTFREVWDEAQRIASYLNAKGVFRAPVLVYMNKTAECLTAFMGVLLSGNFYCPLDVDGSIDNANKIMKTMKPICIITENDNFEKSAEFAINVDRVTYGNATKTEINEKKLKEIHEKLIETDLAYVLFTSGSTGRPKGVAIGHKALTAYIHWVTKAMDFNTSTIFGCQHPFLFSASVTDIYGTLMAGSTLWIIPHTLFKTPTRLISWMDEHDINTIYWVPSALGMICRGNTFEEIKPHKLTHVLFAGEPMPPTTLEKWKNNCNPGTIFANLFGPTETVDICVYYIFPDDWKNDGKAVPIGRACKNCDSFIVSENSKLTEIDEIGELCVRGPFLAYGYYNDPEKTSVAFVQNPLQNAYPETVYRTGDLVSMDNEGVIHYHGRKDNQIKIMGYRIELGEIETAISEISEIDSCCCLFDDVNKLIVCVYKGDIDKTDIRKKIKGKIARYMMPHRYIKVEAMPLNGNRKIDRSRLKKEFLG